MELKPFEIMSRLSRAGVFTNFPKISHLFQTLVVLQVLLMEILQGFEQRRSEEEIGENFKRIRTRATGVANSLVFSTEIGQET